MTTFEELSLLGLIEKILQRRDDELLLSSSNQPSDPIEVIHFDSEDKDLLAILKHVQIKLYPYAINNEKFIFLLFQNNTEREEIMQ